MKTLGIIPARFGSTRLPGKPLKIIQGKPMIQWTYESVLKSKLLDEAVVATDHKSIAEVVTGFGGKAVMTSEDHPSGTDRCREAFEKLNSDATHIINIQGDEPFIPFQMIDDLILLMKEKKAEIGTLCKKMDGILELSDPNKVKVVLTKNQKALYFSRQAIPFNRNSSETSQTSSFVYYKHIGIYGFTAGALNTVGNLAPGSLEQMESLEQLRWLENDLDIYVGITELTSPSVDTQEDLNKLSSGNK